MMNWYRVNESRELKQYIDQVAAKAFSDGVSNTTKLTLGLLSSSRSGTSTEPVLRGDATNISCKLRSRNVHASDCRK